MSKLIQSLPGLEHPQRFSPFIQNSALDQEIHRIYQGAAEEMRQNRQGFTQEFRVTEDKIITGIHIRVTAELDAVNLHSLADYKKIHETVLNWNPDQSGKNFRECVAVKKALMTCLADARKKQSLQRICCEYKAHLAADIRAQLNSDFPNVSRQYGLNLPEPRLSFKKPLRPAQQPSTLDHFLTGEVKSLSIAPDSSLHKAIRKYEAVTTLQYTLLTHKPAPIQVQEFSQTLNQLKPVLEAHRDSNTVRFLKKISAAVTFGITAALGIFGVKGKQMASDLTQVLASPPPVRGFV